LASALAALLVAVTPFAPAGAQAPDPNQIVSSDGRQFTAPQSAASVSRGAPRTGSEKTSPQTVSQTKLPPRMPQAPESVIGLDGRTRVMDTTVYPNSAIAYVESTYGTATYTCTAWFIGPSTLATAGHCVHEGMGGNWADEVVVYPGRNGASAPFGSDTATVLYSVLGWVNNGDHRYDYGAIQVAGNWQNTVGYFGFFWNRDNTIFQNKKFKLFGYPGDKGNADEQWGMNGKIKQVQARKFFYNHDTFGGQSGSPVWKNRAECGGPCGAAIHAYGVGVQPYTTFNSGTRINRQVFNNLKAWKNSAP
jgi:glutamyl endopeptidase